MPKSCPRYKSQITEWGLDVVRVEVKEIDPPKEVQETMKAVIQANNKKVAAIDLAQALATQADGEKQAANKRSEGLKQSAILEAEGQANAIKTVAEAEASKIGLLAAVEANKIEVVNQAAQEYFKENAIIMKELEVTQQAMQENTKFVIVEKGTNPTLVLDGGNGSTVPIRPNISKIT